MYRDGDLSRQRGQRLCVLAESAITLVVLNRRMTIAWIGRWDNILVSVSNQIPG